MGEIVVDVAERVIGREIDAGAHRDLIDEAIAAVRAESAGRRGRAAERLREPGLEGYPTADPRVGRRPTARPPLSELRRDGRSWSSALPSLSAALTDTSVPGRRPPGRARRPPQGRVPRRARRLASFAVGAVSAPEVPAALALAGPLGPAADADGAAVTDDERCSATTARPGQGRRATPPPSSRADRRPSSRRSRTSCSASPASSSRRPALRRALTDRDLPVAVRQGVVDRAARRQAHAGHPAAGRLRGAPGPAPATSSPPWTAWSSRRPGPGAGGWPGSARPRRSTTPSSASSPNGPGRLTGAPVELQVTVDPDLLGGPSCRSATCWSTPPPGADSNELREDLLTAGTVPRRPTTTDEEDTLMAELTIDADEITAALQRHVDEYTPEVGTEQVGRIVEVGDGIARVSGLPERGGQRDARVRGRHPRPGPQPRRGHHRRRRAGRASTTSRRSRS